jgi:hypothetical protein
MKECASSSIIVVLLSSPHRFSAPPSNEDAGRVDEALSVGTVKVLLTMKIAAIVIGECLPNNGFGTDSRVDHDYGQTTRSSNDTIINHQTAMRRRCSHHQDIPIISSSQVIGTPRRRSLWPVHPIYDWYPHSHPRARR